MRLLSKPHICFAFFILLLIGFRTSHGQVAIGTGATPNNINPKAVLLLVGDGKQGIIIPIVTNKTNVSAGPTEMGMVVFDESDKKVYYFDGTAWNQVGGSGAAGSQGITINGNTVQLNSTAGATFGLSNTAPTGKGQLLVWDGTKWDATLAPTTTGQTLSWDNTNGKWTLANASLTLAGDVSGPSNNTSIASSSGNNIVAALNNAATTSKILPAQVSAGAPNQVLTTSGSNVAVWANLPTATGTVTNIATGTGLTGGPITTTGTIALANTSVAVGTYGSTNQIPQIVVDAQGRITSASNVTPTLAGVTNTGFLSTTDWNTFNNKLSGTLANGNIFIGNASNMATGVAVIGDATISNTGALIIQPGKITSAKILDGEIVDADVNASANIADTKLATISTPGKVSGGAITSGTIGGATNINTTGNVTATNLSGNGLAIANLNASNLASGTVPTARIDVGTTANKIVQLDGTGKLPALDGSQLTNLPAGAESDPTVKAINGIVKSNGTVISAATAGTDYQVPLVSGTNIKTINGASVLGLGNITAVTTETDPTVKAINGLVKSDGTTIGAVVSGTDIKTINGTSVLGAGNITAVTTETDPTVTAINGLVKSDGTTIGAVVSGTDIKTINGTSVLGAGNITAVTTETDPTVTAINGLVKSNGTVISAATAGTDYLAPNGNGSALTNLNASNISSGTLPIANGGTGATTAPAARTALGLGTLSTLSTITSTEITDGTIADADISAGAGIVDTKLATISTAGKVSGSAITSGTLGGSAAINSTGNISTSGTLSTGPATVTALTIGTSVWPSNASGSLTNDGTGNLTWVPTGGGGTVTSITKGVGLVAGSAITTSGTIDVNVGTGANQIVQLDGIGKLPALDGSQLTNLPAGAESDPTVKAINGIVKSNGTVISAATAGTDYQVPLVSGTNIKTINGASVLGLGNITAVTTETDPTVTAINGLVKSDGTTIGAVVSGTDIKTINGTSVLGAGNITAVTTETDPAVKAINGLVKSDGTVISAAVAGTDYLTTNQTITLSGDISGSGTTGITTSIGTTAGNNIVTAINNAGTLGTINDNRLATITTAGKVNGGAITTGTIGGNTAINSTGNIATSGTLNAGATAVSGLTIGSTAVNWPSNASGSLTNDGTGNLTWVPTGGGGTVTSITKGVGLVAGSAITTSGTIDVNVGTGANQIVQLDGTGKLPALDGSQLTNLPAGAESDPTVKAINGIVKSNGTVISAATAGTDYQVPLVSGTNIKTINGASVLGLGNITAVTTETDPTVTAINGLVKSDGTTIGAVVSGTDIKTINGTSVLGAGNITAVTTETDPAVKAINGLVKSDGTTIGAVVSGTDIKTINGTSVLGAGNITTLTTVTSADITDGTIVDIDINGSANINGAKINPSFGAQAVSTTSTLTTGSAGQFVVDATGNITKINNITTSFPSAQGGANSVLTNDGAGNLTWAAGSGWNLSGNATTIGNKLGTTNGNPLTFITSGTDRMTIDATGNVGIGTTAPKSKFQIGNRLGLNSASVGTFDGITRNIYINGADAPFYTTTGFANAILMQDGLTEMTVFPSGAADAPITVPTTKFSVTTTGVGINNAGAPAATLDITGNIKISGGTPGAGKVLTSDATGLATWQNAGGGGWGLTGTAGTVDGTNFIGTTDDIPVNIRVNGQKAGRIESNTGLSNLFLGYQAGNVNTASANTGIGTRALAANTTGNGLVAVGQGALSFNTTGLSNTAVGSGSLLNNTTGQDNTAVGRLALSGNSTAGGNSAFGSNSLTINSGSGNTAIGANSLSNNTTGVGNTAIGFEANVSVGNLTNATAIGYQASVNASNTIQLGNSGVTTVNIGTGTSTKLVAGQLQITGGTLSAGSVLTSDASGNATWQGGGWGLTGTAGTVDGINFIGTTDNIPLSFRVNNLKAGRVDITAQNTFFGSQAGNSTTGSRNTAYGMGALFTNTTSIENTALGFNALFQNTAAENTAVGVSALGVSTTGAQNTAVGRSSLAGNTTGANNVALGYSSLLTNTTGSNNTAIGSGADVTTPGLINATAIGYNAKVAASNTLILGGTGADAVNVGIGTSSPNGFGGRIVHLSGTGNTGYILEKTDATARKWAMVTGNTGEYIIQDMTGSVNALSISPGGNVGIGTTTPGALLDITGAANGIRVNSWLSAGSSACGIGYVGTNLYRNASDNVWKFTNTNGTIGGTAINFADCSGTPNQISFVRALGPSTANANATVVESMRIDQNGRVGIGTTAPQAPLDVAFTNNIFLSPTGSTFFNNINGTALSGPGLNPTPSVAVRATGAFLSIGTGEAAGYYVQSDERIKRKVGISDSRNDLATLMKLKITDYKYTDSLNAGNVQVKGVFAQEVEKIYPQAISKQTNFIPNVYALADQASFDEAKQALTITMAKPHNLVVGDKVKLISSTSGEKPSKVIAVNGNNFTVGDWTEKSEKIFVYGKEVNDFRIVDYDRLFTLNLSATQELVKMVDEQKKLIDELKAKEEESRKKIALLEASLSKVAAGETELTNLKSEIEKIKAALGLSVEATTKKAAEKTESPKEK